MYCVALKTLLEMTVVESYEILLHKGMLHEFTVGQKRPVIFVSHQWVSKVHPDPKGEQFEVLKGALRTMLGGHKVRSVWVKSYLDEQDMVEGNWPVLLEDALVWYDYFSVPQHEMHVDKRSLAILSIPEYIELCTFAFILAPTVEDSDIVEPNGEPGLCDVYSWLRRGWCRMEIFAFALKVDAWPPLLIRSAKDIKFCSGMHMCSVVGDGEFRCCSSNHQDVAPSGDVIPIPCDKHILYDVLNALISHRIEYERSVGNHSAARRFLAYRHIWTWNLRDENDSYVDQECFADSTLDDDFDGGWTLLRRACLGGNVEVARRLIDQKADVEAVLEESCGDFWVEKGLTILTHVIQHCVSAEHEQILELLVEHNAKLHPQNTGDALTQASMSFSKAKRGARWLLRKFPDWDVNQKQRVNGYLRWPLFSTLTVSADLDYLKLLCDHKADLTLLDEPFKADALSMAITLCPTSSPELAKFVLQKLRDCNAPMNNTIDRKLAAPWLTRCMLKISILIGMGPTAYRKRLLRISGCTLLIFAVEEGKHLMCKWLVEQRADLAGTNADGETPLSIAEEHGWTHVINVLKANPLKGDSHCSQ